MYGHLPDEQRVLLLGRDVTGNEAHQIAVHFRGDGGVSKVRTLQQVAIDGVLVQRLALTDQLVHPAAVLAFRFAESNVILIVGG